MRFSITEHPFLADHTVQGISVVSGASIAIAVLDEPQFGETPTGKGLTQLRFVSLLPLSDNTAAEYSETKCSLRQDGEQITITDQHYQTTFATMQITDSATLSILENDCKQTQSVPLIAPEHILSRSDIYAKLRQQGNDYGEQFCSLIQLQISGQIGLGTCDLSSHKDSVARATLALDACTHIAATLAGLPSTFVLQEIAQVYMNDLSVPARPTVLCQKWEKTHDGCVADFCILDESNATIAIVRGVRLTLLSNTENAVANGSKEHHAIAVAGSFTLDPLGEFSQFWAERLKNTPTIELGSYNQVFQALLGSDPIFTHGAEQHVCLLRLEDWLIDATNSTTKLANNDLSPEHFHGQQTTMLPNGLTVAEINTYETRYLYQEIFVDLAYRRHGVAVIEGDTVIDIGANIGLFSLFAAQEASDVRVIAVEPSPTVVEVLKANLKAYVAQAVVIAAGAASARGEAEFTAYTNSSVFSTFSSDEHTDRQALRTIIRNSLAASSQHDPDYLDEAVDSLMADRLESETYCVSLVSVSDIIRQHNLNKIGLLKIDAEKSEQAILDGIDDDHWSMIEQIIIEVHKQSGANASIVKSQLEKKGFACTEDEEELLGNSGLVTLYASRPDRLKRVAEASKLTGLKHNSNLYLEALGSYSERTTVPLLSVFCPTTSRDPQVQQAISKIEEQLTEQINASTATNAMAWNKLTEHYPLAIHTNSVGQELGHIPYTRQWYAATATALIRQQLSTSRVPVKVIALDCDNTLWSGVVGEMGTQGVDITAHHKKLYAWVNRWLSEGLLICLVSKNAIEDVKAVFEQRNDLTINWASIAAHRINWQAKSLNLQELAEELNLGLDSFVFIDDSPIECAEVRSQCPQVLTLQMPIKRQTTEDHEEDELDIDTFMRNVWPLDRPSVTYEDRQRNKMLRDERQRKQYQHESPSMQSFIAGLDLQIDIQPLREEQLERASQLTFRTNQFNLTSRRRSTADLNGILAQGYQCVCVSVKDRFGDYGHTGMAIFRINHDESTLQVDTFLLSCRVLARGVEHALLAHLGKLADELQLNTVEIEYIQSAKNEPAKQFLESLPDLIDASLSTPSNTLDTHEIRCTLASLDAIRCRYTPTDNSADRSNTSQSETIKKEANQSDTTDGAAAQSEQVNEIALHFGSIEAILQHADATSTRSRPDLPTALVAPQTELEKSIASVWCSVLRISHVGLYDDFFALGGTSLSAVAMVGKLQASINSNVQIVDLFSAPTIAALAKIIIDAGNPATDPMTQTAGRDRGAARRQRRVGRQRS